MKRNDCVYKARSCNFSFLSRNAAKCSLLELEAMIFKIVENTGERYELKKGTITANLLMNTLHCDEFRVFLQILGTFLKESGEEFNTARQNFIPLTKSVYVFSCRSVTFNH